MESFNGKVVIEDAVVGFVDMVSSTQLSNSVDVQTDWEIKERFLKAAHERAEQCGILMLNLTGDGFLFLANPRGGVEWAHGLAKFQRLVVADYQSILREYSSLIGDVSSGVRIGVAQGRIIIGRIGERDDQYMAVGAAINLASRLCSSAEADRMAMSAAVWDVYGAVVPGAEANMQAHARLKGFDHVVVGFHVGGAKVDSKRDVQETLSCAWAGFAAAQAA